MADDGIDSDHADWARRDAGAGARREPREPVAIVAAPHIPVVPPRMVALPPDPKPAIHGPRITGATPGRPFLFLIPATGEGPLTFSAAHLPAGLKLDSRTGILSGIACNRRCHRCRVDGQRAERHGKAPAYHRRRRP